MATIDLKNKYQHKLEASAHELCQSRKFETGQGTCALICMENINPRAFGCPHALRVFAPHIKPTLRRGAVIALNTCLKSQGDC
jgi:hypothetical protein